MVTEERKVYRPNEVKSVYGLTRDVVFKEIAAGRLKSFTIGKARYITREALEEYLRARQDEAAG